MSLKRSRQERLADPTPGSYQSSLIKVKVFTSANIIRPMIEIQSIQKSEFNMVTVLANLNARSDDSGPNEPLILKKANASHYWKKVEKTMYIEFQYLIKNNTWEYREVSNGQIILTGRWVFKIKKDR